MMGDDMKRLLLILVVLALLSVQGFSQYSIRGTLLAPAADTTILKTRKATRDGTIIFLTELSSGDGIGSGWLVYGDSISTQLGVVRYKSGVAGKHWTRRQFIEEKEIDIQWAGIRTNDSTKYSSNGLIFESLFPAFDNGNYKFVFSDTVWTDSLLLTDVDYVTLIGRKNAVVKMKLASDPVANTPLFHLRDCSYWHIENITFNTRGSKYSEDQRSFQFKAVSETITGIKFIGNTFDNCQGVYFWEDTGTMPGSWRAEDALFHGNTVRNPPSSSSDLVAAVDSCKDFTITDNFYYGLRGGTGSGTHFVFGTIVYNWIVSNNYIEHTSDSGIYINGTNLRISGNIVRFSGKDAIKNLNDPSSFTGRANTIISDNLIEGAGYYIANGLVAINLEGHGFKISDNYIIGNDTSLTYGNGEIIGVKLKGSHADITGNTFLGEGFRGEFPNGGNTAIYLLATAYGDTNVKISDNKVFNFENGIYCSNAASGSCYDITISENKLFDCVDGIYFPAGDGRNKRIIIIDNVLTDITDEGIFVADTDTLIIANNIGLDVSRRFPLTSDVTEYIDHNNYCNNLNPTPEYNSFKMATTDSILFDTGDYMKFESNYIKNFVGDVVMSSLGSANLLLNTGLNYLVDSASDDDYIVTEALITKYTTGMILYVDAVTANTGACTLNLNSLGAKSIKAFNDQNPPDNYIEAGSVFEVIYDGTNFQLLSPDANP
ncbi:MAG: hypothetical protein GY820_38765 [Gammaproteobacteria bacterium]|nr:hypothetical protein [Gammaproteobacteria bacterium]